jgi:hypothetical protein
MPKTPSRFKASELKRATKALQSAGIQIRRVEITEGGIAIITAAEGVRSSESIEGDVENLESLI